MLTWLDTYVKTHVNHLKRDSKLFGMKLDFDNDLEIIRYMTKAMLKSSVEMAQAFALRPEFGTIQYLMAQMVAPFILGGNTLAIQIAPELAEDFHGAKAPDGFNAIDAYMDLIKSHDRIYIDLPPDTYRIGSRWHVRAIIMWPTDKEIYTMVFIPQDGKLNLDRQVEFMFPFGEKLDEIPMVANDYDQGGTEESLNITNVELQEQVQELVKLALLYYITQDTPGVIKPLPQVTEKAYKAIQSEKKRNAKLKSHTLFKVLRLESPRGRFGRTDQDRIPQGGWKLDHRIPVRGHYRWQAVGEKWKDHKLIYVARHSRGPKDAPERPELTIIRKE